jgi:hypothetical protein
MESTLDCVTSRVAEWDLPVSGLDFRVRTPYAYNSETADILLVTGFGEKYIESIAQDLGRRGIELAVTNLAYPEGMTLSFDVMETTVINGLGAVIRDVNQTAGRKPEHPMKLVGHSKGLGELVKLAEVNPQLCSEMTGAAPLGINCKAAAFGNSTMERRAEIKRRLRSSGLLDEMAGDFDELKRLAHEFNAGTEYLQEHDISSVVRSLHAGGKLRHLVIGKKDKLCPPDECRSLVGINGLIVETEGGHDPLSSDSGLMQIELAISLLGS